MKGAYILNIRWADRDGIQLEQLSENLIRVLRLPFIDWYDNDRGFELRWDTTDGNENFRFVVIRSRELVLINRLDDVLNLRFRED
jgi:hypothetical protein